MFQKNPSHGGMHDKYKNGEIKHNFQTNTFKKNNNNNNVMHFIQDIKKKKKKIK